MVVPLVLLALLMLPLCYLVYFVGKEYKDIKFPHNFVWGNVSNPFPPALHDGYLVNNLSSIKNSRALDLQDLQDFVTLSLHGTFDDECTTTGD